MKLFITANGFCKPEMTPILEKARLYFDEVLVNPWGRRGTQEEIRALWDGADAIICGAETFDAAMVAAAPASLKVLSHYGVGVDSIDLAACRKRNIAVCNTPGANAESVADMALCLLLAQARQLVRHDRYTRRGEWKRFGSMELKGKKLGIIGFGAIGRGVAQRAAGFGLQLLAYDPYFNEKAAESLGVRRAGLEEILSGCDFISLHLPCTKETYHVIDRKALACMKDGAILINTARGDLVDEAALYDALTEGKLGGYAADVYAQEPAKENPLFSLENTSFTPHCSANTPEASVAMGMMALENAYRAIFQPESAHIL